MRRPRLKSPVESTPRRLDSGRGGCKCRLDAAAPPGARSVAVRVGPKPFAMLTVLLAVGRPPAVAQVPDHLECYTVKDSIAKTVYTADLAGLVPASGCTIKLPAKQLCVETTKTNVSPLPPGAEGGPSAGR